MASISSITLRQLISDGGSHFFKSAGHINQFFSLVESSEITGPDYKELQNTLNSAIYYMEQAMDTYLQLKNQAAITPYNQEVIYKLLSFNYESFREENGLFPVIFEKVKGFLAAGNVTGIYNEFYSCTGHILDLLYTLKKDVDTEIFPDISNVWKVNQLLAFFCWRGISDYKSFLTNKKPFQEMERDKVSMHLHYTFYGVRGVRLLYIPTPMSVLFNDSTVFTDMTSQVDTAEKLDISNTLKGEDLFSDSGGFMDFVGILLLISCFLALIYGWDATRNQKYLKLISDISGSSKPGFLITLARIILLNLVFLVLSSMTLVWMLINGINAINIFKENRDRQSNYFIS